MNKKIFCDSVSQSHIRTKKDVKGIRFCRYFDSAGIRFCRCSVLQVFDFAGIRFCRHLTLQVFLPEDIQFCILYSCQKAFNLQIFNSTGIMFKKSLISAGLTSAGLVSEVLTSKVLTSRRYNILQV